MTIEYIPFTPNQVALFQFAATLDGQNYTCLTQWNVTGIRYYFYVYDSNGDLIFNVPLTGSPPDYNLSLTEGYFDTPIVFRTTGQWFEVGTA